MAPSSCGAENNSYGGLCEEMGEVTCLAKFRTARWIVVTCAASHPSEFKSVVRANATSALRQHFILSCRQNMTRSFGGNKSRSFVDGNTFHI